MYPEQEAIIKAWEQIHRPKSSRSKLRDYDTLISQKIEQGYTQQAIANLLNALGCTTSHQNLSRYLKKRLGHSEKDVRSTASSSKAKPQEDIHISGYARIKKMMQEN
jgi:predicted transcriptional regulator